MNSSRSKPKQGNLQRASEKGAAAWVKWQRLTLVWSVRCRLSAQNAPSASDAGRRAAAVIPFPSPIGRLVHLSPPLSKTWGELGVFLKRELRLAEHKLKSAVIGGLSFRPFKSRGSWVGTTLFLFVPGEERDKQQAIYNAIDGSQTASFWGDSVTSYINTSNSLGSVL